jgi:hypothetical protein
MTMRATPLSTPGLAAFLTWKQWDILLLLNGNPDGLSATQMSRELVALASFERQMHVNPHYAGTSPTSVQSTLAGLHRRQLVEKVYETSKPWAERIHWEISAQGRAAVNSLEEAIMAT